MERVSPTGPWRSADPRNHHSVPALRRATALLRQPIEFTPIKCYKCQAMFCLEPIETAPLDPSPLVSPISSAAPLPGSRNASTDTTLRPLTLPPVPVTTVGHSTFSSPPPPPQSAKPVATVNPKLAAPAPPPVAKVAPIVPLAANLNAAPGLPTPNEAAKKSQLFLELGPMESLIAVTVTLALVGGVTVGGYYAYRSFVTATAPETDAAVAEVKTPNLDGAIQKVMSAGPLTMPPAPLAVTDAASKESALVGYWVSRADDGSVATIDLRKDGVVEYVGAPRDPDDVRGLKGRWAVTNFEKDIAVIDIYYAATGLELHRLTIKIAGPDCITVVRSVFRGMSEQPEQRFVRQSRPSA